MVALRAADVDAYVARPDPARPVALVFGPDAGLVSERAAALVRASVDDPGDPFALVRLDGDELAADPSRLIDEANTIPLFGGRRALWVKAGGRDFAAAVEALVAQPIRDCRVVIEAGDLRRNAPLRVVCERAPVVAVIACYVDNERDLGRLIDEEMRAANLSIAPEARAALLPLLGGDRRASRNEVRKLTLYARGNARIELDDVAAVVADASALVLDNLIDAAFAGRAAEVESNLARAREAGIAPGRIGSVALLQVGQLHRARTAIEGGLSVPEAADQIVSKAQFRRKGAIEAALRAWTAARLERVMERLAEAALDARRLSGSLSSLADPVVNRALLDIARGARRKGN
jgi:DNA polymerase III subunit delta